MIFTKPKGNLLKPIGFLYFPIGNLQKLQDLKKNQLDFYIIRLEILKSYRIWRKTNWIFILSDWKFSKATGFEEKPIGFSYFPIGNL